MEFNKKIIDYLIIQVMEKLWYLSRWQRANPGSRELLPLLDWTDKGGTSNLIKAKTLLAGEIYHKANEI